MLSENVQVSEIVYVSGHVYAIGYFIILKTKEKNLARWLRVGEYGKPLFWLESTLAGSGRQGRPL
jgi:hypothetical protein